MLIKRKILMTRFEMKERIQSSRQRLRDRETKTGEMEMKKGWWGGDTF